MTHFLKMETRILSALRRGRANPVVRLGARCAAAYLRAWHNESYYNMAHNGEELMLRHLRDAVRDREASPVLFDVGANRGQWALTALGVLPDARIHCFEIVPTIAEFLSNALRGKPNVSLNAVGLSSAESIKRVTCFPSSDSGSSIDPLPWDLPKEEYSCQVITGDGYLQRHRLEMVDMLKIDTEGHELPVLQGFRRALAGGRIRMIQFEYGKTCLPSRTQLRDFYDLLSPLRYKLGRLFPQGVEYKNFDVFSDEHFRMGNYIAVHEREAELQRSTAAGHGAA